MTYRDPARLAAAVLASSVLVAGAPAHAQSSAGIQAYLRSSNAECQIDNYREVFRGTLAGSLAPVVVGMFDIDGCGGGNNHGSAFGIFSQYGGGVQEWRQRPPPQGRVAGVSVSRGRVLVTWRSWRPADPMCCPSIVHHTVYVLSKGLAVAAGARDR